MWWMWWSVACNDCSYLARCDGDTLLVCGASIDQQYNRKVNRVDCDAANPVCVELGDNDATCAVSAEACDAPGAGTCDGEVSTQCVQYRGEDVEGNVFYDVNLLSARDCAAEGQVCAVDGDSSTCASGT